MEEVKGASGLAVPEKGKVALTAPEPPAEEAAPSLPEVGADDYVGDVGDRTGFGGLEALEDVTMLVVPDAMSAYQRGAIDDEGLKAIQLAMIAHCELMGDRVAILDAPPGLNAQKLKDWRMDFAGYDSKYATLYWPWIKVMDPATGKLVEEGTFRAHMVMPDGALRSSVWFSVIASEWPAAKRRLEQLLARS